MNPTGKRRKRQQTGRYKFLRFDIPGYIFHTANGYHPLVCYDGITGDLLMAELRNGSMYCGRESGSFMEPLLTELREDCPGTKLQFRADSGFAIPELYEVREVHVCQYAIRLKQNATLMKLAAEKGEALT